MFSIHSKRFAGRTAALALASSLLLTNVVMLGGCASKNSLKGLTVDKVIKTLEKKFDAEEYDGDAADVFEFYECDDGHYMSGEGDEEAKVLNFFGLYKGIANYSYDYIEISTLQRYIRENDCEYVLYGLYDDDSGSLEDSSAMLVFIEFEDEDDAMDCFEDIMDNAYFSEDPNKYCQVEAYENALDRLEDEIDRYEGTVYGDYIAQNTDDQKVIELDDLTKENYTCDSKSARFDYNLCWETLKMGDVARVNNDDEDYIEEASLYSHGVMGHHLCVEGNKLLLIYGYDYGTSKGDVELVTQLCKAFSTGNPFAVKMDDDLKKYLLFVLNKWVPGGSRLDKF